MSGIVTGELTHDTPESAGVNKPGWARIRAFGSLLATLVVAGVLLHSAVSHFLNPYAFLASIYQYELTGQNVGKVVAATIPFVEVTVALCLLAQVMTDGAWYVATALFAVFAGVQGSVLWRGLDIACGCFGPLESQMVSYRSLTFVMVLLLVSIAMPIANMKDRLAALRTVATVGK